MEEIQEEQSGSQIFIIKVTTNKEDRALELISDKVHKKNLNILSLARPHGLRGYIFLEAADRDSAEEAAYNLPYVKGIIGKTVTYEEIKNMLEPVMEEINIEKGDIVEIIGEPFKKEKAKVIRVDKSKGETVVTLLAAVVPIPVTVKLDNVKVIRREKDESEDSDDSENSEKKEDYKSEETLADDTPLGDTPDLNIDKNYDEPSGGLIPDDY
jgi:transcription termination/antitermination protein NusG